MVDILVVVEIVVLCDGSSKKPNGFGSRIPSVARIKCAFIVSCLLP